MKRWNVVFCVLTCVMLAVFPVAVQAQPAGPATPDDPAAVPVDLLPAKDRHPQATTPDAATAAAVSWGQPGFSYRYVSTLGETEKPYAIDVQHLNRPGGLFVDGSGLVYIAEDRGFRLLKFDEAGQNWLVVGDPGQPWFHADYLSYPQDSVVTGDGSIWVTVQHGVKQLDRFGVLQRTLPASTLWNPGSDNTRFRYPSGLAVDSANKLYVADTGNHRVQVYSLASGAPVYHSTIGQTGVAGNDAGHFSFPARLAVDSSNRVYVADEGNARVQRCTLTAAEAGQASWACTTFHGTGVAGAGADQLNRPAGVAVSALGDVFIADTGNGRVKKCSAEGACTVLASSLGAATDVAVSPSGLVYVSDWNGNVVRRLSADGSQQTVFAGVLGVPYAVTSTRLNAPGGVGLAADGSTYVLETAGYRLLKFDADGQQVWAVGEAGVPGSDAQHLGSVSIGPRGSIAVDRQGRVYVADTGNARVQVFNSDGTWNRSFGSLGAGDNQFNCPSGVAISPATEDILVVDTCNERVQVYNNAWSYKTTLGVTGVAGASEIHFNSPEGVAVDASGAIYVADTDNYRVQKCLLVGQGDYQCTTFAGEQGVFSNSFSHLHPVGVAVDAAGRVAVVDQRNARVQVFDRNGGYLTTIGGEYGPQTGNLRRPQAIAVDAAGALVVADQENHRVQRYAPRTPGWSQINLNGFGSPASALVLSLASFGPQVYAGVDNPTTGGQIWRWDNGAWTGVITAGFGNRNNGGVNHLLPFNGALYAGTWNWSASTSTSQGGQVWRSSNGVNWSQVATNGFGDATNGEVVRFASFAGQLYASTWSYTTAHGSEIWRSPSGNTGSWTRAMTNGFGDNSNEAVLSFEVFGDRLYAGTLNSTSGGEVWRSSDGLNWSQVNSDGFGLSSNWAVSALAAFDGWLYASLRSSGDVWRCQTCDGSDWQRIVVAGFGNAETNKSSALETAGGALFYVAGNYSTGLEVWRTQDGLTWEMVGSAGLGDSNNRSPFWDNSVLGSGSALWVGTWNPANGGEVWSYQPHSVYLPLALH